MSPVRVLIGLRHHRTILGIVASALAAFVATTALMAWMDSAAADAGLGAAIIYRLAALGMFTALVLCGAWLAVGRPLGRLAQAARDGDIAQARLFARRQDGIGTIAAAALLSLEQKDRIASEEASRRLAEDELRQANQQLKSDLVRRELAEQALRESEGRMQLALQGGDLCMWEIEVATMHWIIDRGWMSYRGVTLDPTIGDSTAWESVVDQSDLVQLRARLVELSNDRAEVIEHSFRVRKDDGQMLWIMIRGRVTDRHDDARAKRIAGTMLDITRWQTIEEQLRQAQKLESIGQLAAGIAHEINTPIQFIGDNLRFASESFTAMSSAIGAYRAAVQALPPGHAAAMAAQDAEERLDLAFVEGEMPKALGQSIDGVERVAEIVRAMKEFAHPGSAEKVPSDLNHLVENALAITRNSWKYVSELSLELDRALPPVPLAVGDFNQALLNLIVNAAQAIEDAQRQGKREPGRITVSTSAADGRVVLRISDNGCGMTPEIKARIWDPFFTTKEVGRGTGQGLTVVLTAVKERHGGTIDCETAAGSGTTFTVRLPLTAA